MTLHQLSDLFELQQGEHLKPLFDLFIWAPDEELLKLDGSVESWDCGGRRPGRNPDNCSGSCLTRRPFRCFLRT